MQISYLFFLEIEQPLIAQAYCVDSGFVCLKKKKKNHHYLCLFWEWFGDKS